MNGYGTLKFNGNNRVYEGSFKNGEPCGTGKLSGQDFIYSGEFLNGLFDG